MVTNVLDQASIADAINRQKVGSQRTKNEMMRQGTQDPGSFAMNNQQQISQAQQPQEFWGAGRKETPVGTDESLIGAIGGTKAKLGGQDFYYSPYDVTKASWGTQDADDIDLGGGKYNIMHNGNSLGTGYKSLADTIKDYQMKQYSPKATQQWQQTSLPQEAYGQQNILGGEYGVAPEIKQDWLSSNNYRAGAPVVTTDGAGDNFSQTTTPTWEKLVNGFSAGGNGFYGTEAEALQAQQDLSKQYITGNATRDWETLGQILNYGGVTGDFTTPHAIGGNKQADLISGLNTLYGSKPVIYDGKLLGYNSATGVDPITDQWSKQNVSTDKSGGLFNKKTTTTQTWDVGNLGMGRQSVDPTWLQNNAISGGDGTHTISAEKAANNPGWYNQDYFNRNAGSNSQSSKQGFLGGVFNILDPILDKVDPMHNKVQEWTTGSAERDQQAPYFQKIAPMIVNAFLPGWGSALSALDSASLGDGKGAIGNAVGSYLGMSGGFDTGYGNLANASANSAAGSAINSFSSGGDLADMFKAAATGALGGAAGSSIGSATSGLNPALSGFLSGAAKGAVSSLAQPKAMFESALSSGASGGLAGMFTPTNATPTEKRQAQSNASDAVKLAKLFIKKK